MFADLGRKSVPVLRMSRGSPSGTGHPIWRGKRCVGLESHELKTFIRTHGNKDKHRARHAGGHQVLLIISEMQTFFYCIMSEILRM